MTQRMTLKELWQTLKTVLHRGHVSVLPEYTSSSTTYVIASFV